MQGFLVRILTTAAIVAAVFVSAAAQSDDETITVDAQFVILNATVTTADGKPATGLKKERFKVFEDGREQKIELFLSEKTPFAAAILLDTSGSMEQRVSLGRSAAITFLERLRTDDVAAIYNFDSKVSLVQDFSGSRDLVDAFFDLKADGWTVMNDAIIKAAAELANRPEKRRAIIVLSDGADTKSAASTDRALKAALAANATIYTVDMSSTETPASERMKSQDALKNLASRSGGQFIATPGGVALRDAFRSIVNELGVQYTITYQTTNVAKDGKWRSIELKLDDPTLKVRTRKGYQAAKAGK